MLFLCFNTNLQIIRKEKEERKKEKEEEKTEEVKEKKDHTRKAGKAHGI